MSRAPSGSHPHYTQQQPMAYPPNVHPSYYQQNASAVYPPDPHNPHAHYGRQHQVNGSAGAWQGGGASAGQMEGYPNAAASSSRGEPYPPYSQPQQQPQQMQHRDSPTAQGGRPGTTGGGYGAWGLPSTPSGRGGVKLEDLVSSDPRTGSAVATPQQVQQQGKSQPLSSMPLGGTNPSNAADQQGGLSSQHTGGRKSIGGEDKGKDKKDDKDKPQQGPSDFIKKLYKMLEEEQATHGKGKKAEKGKRGPVGWGADGTSFVVWEMNDFTTKILPQTFRHSNFSSFVRQLNKYGFSKIKHIDKNSGTIRENVWEFQHPDFQAGGKSNLESIKRKPVQPKRPAVENSNEAAASPVQAVVMNGEDAQRINFLENRIMTLEEALQRSMAETAETRMAQAGMMGLLRDLVGHVAATENEAVGTPTSNGGNTPRVINLIRSVEALTQTPTFGVQQVAPMPFTPSQPQNAQAFMNTAYSNNNPAFSGGSVAGAQAQASTPTDGTNSRGSFSGPSTVDVRPPSSASRLRAVSNASAMGMPSVPNPPAVDPTAPIVGPSAHAEDPADDVIEIPNQMETMYEGESLGLTPVFVETPAWLTEGTSVPLTMYRKQSDGQAMKTIYEAFATGGNKLPEHDVEGSGLAAGSATAGIPGQTPLQSYGNGSSMGIPLSLGTPTSAESTPSSKPSKKQGKKPRVANLKEEREAKLKPHWSQTPKILVVEDDVVYRTLSKKFLQKFGCETETVENAQGAVDKMNGAKYDLVLMDIFFGPNMDGRKATSLIRQFNKYTPIISMTSNAQPQDVDSYFQSGMNDILAKPFTKSHLFTILDRHLVHLRHAQLYEKLIPFSVGLPPLSDQHVQEALAVSAASLQNGEGMIGFGAGLVGDNGQAADGQNNGLEIGIRNPLAGTGWSDEAYQLVLGQFLQTGVIPDIHTMSSISTIDPIPNGNPTPNPNEASGSGTTTIGTNVVFGESSGFNRKRSIDALTEDNWEGQVQARAQVQAQAQAQAQVQAMQEQQNMAQAMQMPTGVGIGLGEMEMNGLGGGGNMGVGQVQQEADIREAKRARGMTQQGM